MTMTYEQAREEIQRIVKDWPGTVIDDNYLEILEEEGRRKTLKAFRLFTHMAKNLTFFNVYEGYTLEEILDLDHAYWSCQCQSNYIHDREKKNKCSICKYKPFYLPSPTKNEVKYMLMDQLP